MFRILLSSILIGTTLLLGFLSSEMGSPEYTFQTWYGSFMLPIWSIFMLSLWHDFGKIINQWIPSKFNPARPYISIVWTSLMITYIVSFYIELWATPLLLVLPILMIPFRQILTHDWNELPMFSWMQFSTLIWWAVSSYIVYWVLTAAWIIARIWLIESTTNSVVFYMR